MKITTKKHLFKFGEILGVLKGRAMRTKIRRTKPLVVFFWFSRDICVLVFKRSVFSLVVFFGFPFSKNILVWVLLIMVLRRFFVWSFRPFWGSFWSNVTDRCFFEPSGKWARILSSQQHLGKCCGWLVGGFKYVLCSSRSLGKWSNLTSIFFRWVELKPPTSW